MKKKLLAGILSAALCVTAFTGCNGGNNTSTGGGKQLPDYDAKSDLEFILTSWYAPTITSESLDTYIEAGFNEIMLQGNNIGGLSSTRAYEAALLCEEKGLNYYLCCENQVDSILSYASKYNGLEHCVGIDVYDEPLINDGVNTLGNKTTGLMTLANYVESFQELYDDYNFFVNLHPLDAANVQFKGSYDEYIAVTCEEILAKLNEGDRWLSADSYPLRNKGSTAASYYLKVNWLLNLAQIARAKYITYSDLGLKTNFYIQAMPFSSTYNRFPSYEDLSMQIYALMAFGYDSCNYFCYGTPPENFEFSGEQYALVDRDGNTTPTYTAAKRINHEIRKFDHVYMQFNAGWKGVLPIVGTKNSKGENESFTNLKDYANNTTLSVRTANLAEATAENDTLIGVMTDEEGNYGYMLVNYNETTLGLVGNVELTFRNATKAQVYRNGVKEVVDVKNNKLTLPLGVGEGVFVIPYAA